MKTKFIKLIGSTIMALSILVSCDSDDAFKYEPYVRGIDPLWGYMNGMVTNMKTGEQYYNPEFKIFHFN